VWGSEQNSRETRIETHRQRQLARLAPPLPRPLHGVVGDELGEFGAQRFRRNLVEAAPLLRTAGGSTSGSSDDLGNGDDGRRLGQRRPGGSGDCALTEGAAHQEGVLNQHPPPAAGVRVVLDPHAVLSLHLYRVGEMMIGGNDDKTRIELAWEYKVLLPLPPAPSSSTRTRRASNLLQETRLRSMALLRAALRDAHILEANFFCCIAFLSRMTTLSDSQLRVYIVA
jgi:hypothetical protein